MPLHCIYHDLNVFRLFECFSSIFYISLVFVLVTVTRKMEPTEISPPISTSLSENSNTESSSSKRRGKFFLLRKSPHKKVEVIEKLAEKYQVKFQFKKGSCGRPRKDLNKRKRLADRVSLSC